MTVHRPTEAACQATIVAAARRAGWMVHATPKSQRPSGAWTTPAQGDIGFVDLLLVRGPRILAIELKRRPNKVESAQQIWIDALTRSGVDARVVWVPEQLDELVLQLTRRD